MKEIKIGLIGCGVVGGGVVELLKKNSSIIKERSGIKFSIKTICALNIDEIKTKYKGYNYTLDYNDVINDPEISLVVELIGGTTIAKKIIIDSLKKKKHVVTANKAAVSKFADLFFNEAKKNGVELFYEAAIGGGIPIIKVLREGLIGNRVKQLYCIINGTTNYILSQMSNNNATFKDALSDAQKLGFAELDPTLDINGGDACHKTALLAMLAFNTKVPKKVFQEGIENIQAIDVQYAAELGYKIKLIGIVKDCGKGYIDVRVHPTLLPTHSELAAVENEYNAVFINSDFLGSSLYYGKGAGAHPTASAVFSDIHDIGNIVISGQQFNPGRYSVEDNKRLLPMSEVQSRYYLRINTIEKPGILGKISSIFGKYNISIKSLIQKDASDKLSVPIVFQTFMAKEKDIVSSLKEITSLKFCKGKPIFYRIEELGE